MWDFPHDGGATIKYGRTQIAVFNFASRGEWYATQNMCPHRREFVLSRGMIGDQNGKPKVACPVHKKTFSLESGQCLSGEDYSVQVFPVKIEGDDVYLQLPPVEELDARSGDGKDLQWVLSSRGSETAGEEACARPRRRACWRLIRSLTSPYARERFDRFCVRP